MTDLLDQKTKPIEWVNQVYYRLTQATRPYLPAASPGRAAATPFRNAAEAWFWTMAALRARHEGARTARNPNAVTRPCEPDDVVKCQDQLYRQRRIDLVHARILRIWGERGMQPNPALPRQRSDWRLWTEALERLDAKLRAKGIVAG